MLLNNILPTWVSSNEGIAPRKKNKNIYQIYTVIYIQYVIKNLVVGSSKRNDKSHGLSCRSRLSSFLATFPKYLKIRRKSLKKSKSSYSYRV